MMVTPLQVLLREKRRPLADVMRATGCQRHAVWRWANGTSYPERESAAALIALFESEGLDYNGCYMATVEVADE